MNDGRALEERVAEVFRDAGCDADTRVLVVGARAEHALDVWVTFDALGLREAWAVECKDTRANVPKQDVLTFQGVVQDVGASRGIMVAASGYQPQARAAAGRTNLLLLTMAELQEVVGAHIRVYRLDQLAHKVAELRDRMADEIAKVRSSGGVHTSRVRSGRLQDRFISTLGRLSIMQVGLEQLKLGKTPRYVVPLLDEEEPVVARSFTEYYGLSEKFLNDVQSWLNGSDGIQPPS